MDSDDDTFDNVDSGNVSSGEDDFPMEVDMNSSKERQNEPEDYPFEVLTTEEIVQHMVDCIKEVNTVVEVRDMTSTFIIILFECVKVVRNVVYYVQFISFIIWILGADDKYSYDLIRYKRHPSNSFRFI